MVGGVVVGGVVAGGVVVGGVVGGVVGVLLASSTSRKSTLGRPLDVIGLSRMVLLPAFAGTVKVLIAHVDHPPVPSNVGVCTAEPLTIKLACRAVLVPLANRTRNVAGPAVDAFTVNSAYAPAALSPLQNPLPEKPAQSASIVPVQIAGEFSTS